MDIDESDLLQLFEMIDVNGEGEIAAAEFIAPLTRWVHDSKTAPRFIKYNVLRSLTQQEELYELTKSYFDILDTRIQELSDSLARVAPGPMGILAQAAQAGLSSIGLQSLRSLMTEEMECADGAAELAEAQEVDAEVEQPHASKPALWGIQSEVQAGVRQGSSELQARQFKSFVVPCKLVGICLPARTFSWLLLYCLNAYAWTARSPLDFGYLSKPKLPARWHKSCKDPAPHPLPKELRTCLKVCYQRAEGRDAGVLVCPKKLAESSGGTQGCDGQLRGCGGDCLEG